MFKKLVPVLLIFSAICIVLFAQDAMTILADNGNVGIGTEEPEEKLHVNGNLRADGEILAEMNGQIKNILPYLAPVGTVLPFAGSAIPEGWLVCDGTAYGTEDYADLFTVIGYAWGRGADTSRFRVPDLCGQFLRGVDDSGKNIDPGPRYRKHNGYSTSLAGTYQDDALQDHQHNYKGDNNADDHDNDNSGDKNIEDVNTLTTEGVVNANVSSETRPKNAYVYFIIKY